MGFGRFRCWVEPCARALGISSTTRSHWRYYNELSHLAILMLICGRGCPVIVTGRDKVVGGVFADSGGVSAALTVIGNFTMWIAAFRIYQASQKQSEAK